MGIRDFYVSHTQEGRQEQGTLTAFPGRINSDHLDFDISGISCGVCLLESIICNI